jgi:transposase
VKEAAGDIEKIRIMFEDEARFGRISDTRYYWAPKGTRPFVPLQFVREYTYAYAAGKSLRRCPRFSRASRCQCLSPCRPLSIVAERHPDELILMSDQAVWHKAKALEIPVNIKLLNLPPYNPELNPTEHLWEDIREKWFPNLAFKSITAVEDTLVDGLVSLRILVLFDGKRRYFF